MLVMDTILRVAAAAVIAITTAVGGATVMPATRAEAPAVVTVAADNLPDVSGTVRWVNATTWEVLNDAGHTPNGIGTVEVKPDRLRVHYTFTALKVSSFQATPDEMFTSVSVRVGASVGLSYVDLFFYMPASGSTPVNPALLSKAGANVWLTGWFITN